MSRKAAGKHGGRAAALSSGRAVALGILAGYAADLALGDPRRGHPVAGFGTLAAAMERHTHRDSRAVGTLHTGALVTATAALAGAADRRLAGSTWARTAFTAALVWTVIGGRSLRREAAGIADALERGDLEDARRRLPSLCGRDPSNLSEAELVRAALESVAENTSDAVVAPLFWGAIGGPAGLAGYRAANTLDAMIGHKSPRYRRFGWAAARLDDAANWAPARLAALLTTALAPLVGGSPRRSARVWLRDGGHHPSPNAGQVEAAFAGALDVTLGGGENRYAGHTDSRPALGDGPAPVVADLRRANRLAAAVSAASAIGAAAVAVGVGAARRERRFAAIAIKSGALSTPGSRLAPGSDRTRRGRRFAAYAVKSDSLSTPDSRPARGSDRRCAR
ncbi:cobalamin biosynthesis protein [Glycomyces buryatensis]|uniref:Cobalamin biosynthesis protein CobD n=1 Tax=Glycomyces buryatensis TaxID=2570927 RepID=A0A4V4HSK8_9ACTN|nr:cobalamin biosynthesis protein [Glycomyces buryatensis]THV42076.1 cobalamin biosynthesis protein [Glycomyces buryatensis]